MNRSTTKPKVANPVGTWTTAAALGAFAPAAGAALMVSNEGDAFTVVRATNDVVAWNIDGTGGAEFNIRGLKPGQTHPYGLDILYAEPLNTENAFVKTAAMPGDYMQKLSSAFVIGPSLGGSRFDTAAIQGFIGEGTNTPGGTLIFGTQFVGFKFEAVDGIHYGWADITLSATQVTFNAWSWQSTPNTAVTVGPIDPVPEPSTMALSGLGLLAAGAAGVREWKRRKALAS